MKLKQVKTCSTILIAAIMFLISYACTEQSLTVNDETKTVDGYETAERDAALATRMFTRTVGAPISARMANEWVDNYKKANNNTGKEYRVQTKAIDALLADKTIVGICFYYATDKNGQTHILPIGIGSGGKEISTTKIFTEAGDIDNAEAQEWIANYQGSVKAHYWGSTTLATFIKTLNGNDIRATQALNNNSQPQLLLSDAGTANPSYRLDDSSPCPPVCTK